MTDVESHRIAQAFAVWSKQGRSFGCGGKKIMIESDCCFAQLTNFEVALGSLSLSLFFGLKPGAYPLPCRTSDDVPIALSVWRWRLVDLEFRLIRSYTILV